MANTLCDSFFSLSALCHVLRLFFSGFPPQSSLSHIKIGDKVRVKPTVTTPKYKWGSVTHRSVGVVKGETVSASASQFDFDSIYTLTK